MRTVFLILSLCLVAGLQACATSGEFDSVSSANDFKIQNSAPISFYSFLNIRESTFGVDMISSVNNKVAKELENRGHKIHVAQTTDMQAAGSLFDTKLSTSGFSTDKVPVAEAVSYNQPNELKNGSKYRLIAIPSNVNLQGAWQYFTVSWLLMDVNTEKVVWMTKQSGKRLVMWKTDEASESRSDDMVENLIAEMENSGVFN